MSNALSVAEAGIAAVREAESKAGAAFRLLVEENDALTAERDELREALQSIESAPRHSKLSDHELVDWMQAVALATLNKETHSD